MPSASFALLAARCGQSKSAKKTRSTGSRNWFASREQQERSSGPRPTTALRRAGAGRSMQMPELWRATAATPNQISQQAGPYRARDRAGLGAITSAARGEGLPRLHPKPRSGTLGAQSRMGQSLERAKTIRLRLRPRTHAHFVSGERRLLACWRTLFGKACAEKAQASCLCSPEPP